MNRWLTGAFVLPLLAMLGWPVSSIAYEAVAVTNGGAIVGAVKYAGDPPHPRKSR